MAFIAPLLFCLIGCLLFSSSAFVSILTTSHNLANKSIVLQKSQRGMSLRSIPKKKPQNKQLEAYAKVKRLKQIMNESGNYTKYLEEKKRYFTDSGDDTKGSDSYNDSDENSSEDIIDIQRSTVFNVDAMKRVLQYKKEQEERRQRGSDRDTALFAHKTNTLNSLKTNCRVAFLPDCGRDSEYRSFYRSFIESFSDGCSNAPHVSVDIVAMPDIHEFNTKRYETKWMDYMRELKLFDYELIVAHGTSGEALLRYMESEPIRACILIDASDLYTAGERHGRAFRYSLIKENCKYLYFRLIHTTKKGEDDSITLSKELSTTVIDSSFRPETDVNAVGGKDEFIKSTLTRSILDAVSVIYQDEIWSD